MRRLKLDQADWHVTARGARRLLLFHDDADFKVFYAMLGDCCRDSGMSLFSDCLMSNHFHLGLSGGSTALTRCMQRLNRSYSGYHNDRYDLSGHAFDQEYYAEPIPSGFILARVARYIHLNPVRAGRSDRPELYPWSSYRRLTTAAGDLLSAGEKRILQIFDPDLPEAQTLYKAFTEKDMRRRVTAPAGKTSAWEIWQEQFIWVLDHLIERREFLEPIEPELIATHFGSRLGIPPRAMAKVLGCSDGRPVSDMIRRFKRKLERNPGLEGKLASLGIL